MKKGYAFKKAVEFIAWERGGREGKKPSLPRSRAKRGAIQSWRKKLERGYRPRQKESKEAFQKALEKNDIGKDRPFMRINGQWFSKRPGNDIRDVILGFSNQSHKDGSNRDSGYLFEEVEEEKLDIMLDIAEELGKEKDPKVWEREFKKYGFKDIKFTTSRYL